MSSEVVMQGTSKPDGTLEVPGRIDLLPGPVEVTVRSTTPITGTRADWWTALVSLRNEMASRGDRPRSAEAIDTAIQDLRDEWEEHQLGLERISRAAGPGSERSE